MYTKFKIASLLRYIEFFMECFVDEDSISWIFYLANRIKTIKDLHSENSDVIIILKRSQLESLSSGRFDCNYSFKKMSL